MKIIQVKIQKFKKLKNQQFDLAGKSAIILGENGLGKSSILQFIQIALGDQTNIPPDAEGAGQVIANKDGEEYTFKVQFKGNKPVIEVTFPNGLKDTRKSELRSIVGAIDFDINEFVELSDSEKGRKEQVKIYKSLLPEDVIGILNKLEEKIKKAYDDRTELNRLIKTLEGFIKQSPLWGEDLEIQPVDISDLQKKLADANTHNNKVNEVITRKEERSRSIIFNDNEIAELQAKIKRLTEENNKSKTLNTQAEEWLSENPIIPTDALNQQITDASEINVKASQAKELKEKQAQLENYQNQAGEMTVLVETGRHEIAQTIREMTPVVEGLEFDEEQLLYNGTPVSTASLSYSEIIELGIKLKLAQNPEFGTLFIDNAESIGQHRLDEIMAMADKKGLQIIFAQVERGQEEIKVEIIGE